MSKEFIDSLIIKADNQPADIETLLKKKQELTSKIQETRVLLEKLNEELIAINDLLIANGLILATYQRAKTYQLATL